MDSGLDFHPPPDFIKNKKIRSDQDPTSVVSILYRIKDCLSFKVLYVLH